MRTVAVYSDADAHAAHVAACDEAVHIGGPRPQESYLRGDVILEAARRTGADAIHPGYGFLSENARIRGACARAGLVFVGPSPEAIAAMGSKSAAKALMEQAGVPLTPGYHGDRQEPDYLLEEARRIGFPVLIKAVAGGGGKGMRRVDRAGDFAAALASCRREAAASFNDDRVLVEKYVSPARHIEVQVFGDTHGQRRLSIRARLLGAAAAPEGHRGSAGARHDGRAPPADGRGRGGRGARRELHRRRHRGVHRGPGWRVLFHGNEHAPAGGASGDRDDHRARSGGVAAARRGGRAFAAAPGASSRFTAMPSRRASTPRIPRAISCPPSAGSSTWRRPRPRPSCASTPACAQGDEISPYYDPMIAKLIVHGATRAEAIARLRAALAQYQVVGVHTNIEFLHRLTSTASFEQPRLDTALIERERAHCCRRATAPASRLGQRRRVPGCLSPKLRVAVGCATAGGSAAVPRAPYVRTGEWEKVATLRFGDPRSGRRSRRHRRAGRSRPRGGPWDVLHVFFDGAHWQFKIVDPYLPAARGRRAHGGLMAPMPGRVLAVLVSRVRSVARGTPLHRHGSNENGAHHHGAGGRYRRANAVRRRRAGEGGRRAAGALDRKKNDAFNPYSAPKCGRRYAAGAGWLGRWSSSSP